MRLYKGTSFYVDGALNAQMTMKDENKRQHELVLKNFTYLYRTRNITQYAIRHYFEALGVTLNQGTISLYLSGKLNMPMAFVVHLGTLFHVPLESVLFEDIEALEGHGIEPPAEEAMQCASEVDPWSVLSPAMFVTGAASHELRGIMGSYFMATLPPKPHKNEYFDGNVEIAPGANGSTHILLRVNVLPDGEQEIQHKEYIGTLCYSKGTMSYHGVVTNAPSGEVVFLIFRTYQPTNQPLLSCVIAALSVGRGRNNHAPVAMRILLSRKEISPAHMEFVLPFLHITNEDILIEAGRVAACEKEVEEKTGTDGLLHRMRADKALLAIEEGDSDVMLRFSEVGLASVAASLYAREEYLTMFPLLLSIVRKHAYADKNDMSGNETDEAVYDLLRSFGYFPDIVS